MDDLKSYLETLETYQLQEVHLYYAKMLIRSDLGYVAIDPSKYPDTNPRIVYQNRCIEGMRLVKEILANRITELQAKDDG